MKVFETIIHNFSICTILQTAFLLFMSIYISIGDLSHYLDCFEANQIEQTEKKDIDSEENEGKEEIDKDEFIKKLFSHKFLDQEKYFSRHSKFYTWNQTHGEIPTPPPRFIT